MSRDSWRIKHLITRNMFWNSFFNVTTSKTKIGKPHQWYEVVLIRGRNGFYRNETLIGVNSTKEENRIILHIWQI